MVSPLRIALLLILVYIPANFLLPCECVLRDADPRPWLLLIIAGLWIFDLILCARAERHSFFLGSLVLGVPFFILAFVAMPR